MAPPFRPGGADDLQGDPVGCGRACGQDMGREVERGRAGCGGRAGDDGEHAFCYARRPPVARWADFAQRESLPCIRAPDP